MRAAPPLPVWSEAETAWLAGLLEGEGTFTASYHNGPRSPRTPRVGLAMTDADVIKRAAALLNTSVLDKKTYPTELGRPRKPQTQLVVYGVKALEVMARVRPLMGARRTARIDELTAEWHNVRRTV